MPDTASRAAIRRLPTERPDLFAYEIDGHMSADAIRDVYRELDEAYDSRGRIDLLVRMTGYAGFDWSAAFSDLTYSVKRKSLSHLRRYAIVGGPSWVRALVALFDPLLHPEMRWFPAEEEDAAWRWLDAG